MIGRTAGSRSKARDRAIVDVFFALGDATRLAVVKTLGAGIALSATTLADGAAISRQAVVKHLQVLEAAGLVKHERQGRQVLYALEPQPLAEARSFLDRVSASWDCALERLRLLVEQPPRGVAKRKRTRRA